MILNHIVIECRQYHISGDAEEGSFQQSTELVPEFPYSALFLESGNGSSGVSLRRYKTNDNFSVANFGASMGRISWHNCVFFSSMAGVPARIPLAEIIVQTTGIGVGAECRCFHQDWDPVATIVP